MNGKPCGVVGGGILEGLQSLTVLLGTHSVGDNLEILTFHFGKRLFTL